MIAIVLKASLLIALAVLVDRSLRPLSSAAIRHLVWTSLVGALLVLPIVSAIMPKWTVFEDTQPRSAALAVVTAMSITTSAAPSWQAISPQPDASTSREVAWPQLAFLAWLIGALVLLARVMRDHVTVWRLSRACTGLNDRETSIMAEQVSAELGIRHAVRLLESATANLPLTWGVLRPTVLLPLSARSWSPSRRRAVLLHELAHVRRHDCFTQMLAGVACALYWPHPGVWYAAGRLREEREFACDDVAAARGGSARDYARHLLEIAHGCRASWRAATVSMASSPIEKRLRALTDASRSRVTPRRAVTVCAAVLSGLLTISLATATSVQEQAIVAQAPEPPKPPPAPGLPSLPADLLAVPNTPKAPDMREAHRPKTPPGAADVPRAPDPPIPPQPPLPAEPAKLPSLPVVPAPPEIPAPSLPEAGS